MNNLKQQLLKLASDESGQDLIEYALMASLLGLGTLAGLRGVKTSISNSFGQIGNTLTNATS
jgi:pilus assembly protein Flp/PilA